MRVTDDSRVIILLCSHLGLTPDHDLTPFTTREWNPLARVLQTKGLRPADLVGLNTDELKNQLDSDDVDHARIFRLLVRMESLSVELDRLYSLGISVVTRADEDYPDRYRQRLKDSSPAVLFYAGEKALLGQPGIAVVGSRHLDEIGQACADFVGNACGISGLVLYSGGAKGVDSISMGAALGARGTAVGILADSLEKAIRLPEYRSALGRGDLCLVTPYSPSAPFSVGSAMGRNKLIYTLADYAIVVASDAEKGGTWAGATEAMRAKWLPVFVLNHSAMSEGNKLLLQKGAIPFPHPFDQPPLKLQQWLDSQVESATPPLPQPSQPSLF